MIVYVFYDNFFKKFFLPIKTIGVYPFYYAENRLLFNIEAENDKWYIKTAESFAVHENGDEKIRPELIAHNTYTILNNNHCFYVIACPLYYPNSPRYSVIGNELSFGANVKNALCDSSSNAKEIEYRVKKDENSNWYIEVATRNVYLNDKLVAEKTYLKPGDYIFCWGTRIIFIAGFFIINGSNKLSIREDVFSKVGIQPAAAPEIDYEITDDMPLHEKKDYFTKAPRFKPDIDIPNFTIEPVPFAEKAEDTPMILLLGPQLTMMSMSVISALDVVGGFIEGTVDTFRFFTSMMVVVVMLAGVIIWPTITRGYRNKLNKIKNNKKIHKYKQYLENQTKLIEEAKNNKRKILSYDYPPLSNCQEIIQNRKNSLWSKKIDDDDFLSVSLGIGEIPSELKVDYSAQQDSSELQENLVTAAKKIVEDSKYLSNAPFAYSLTQNFITAVIGSKPLCDRLLDNIFLQIMTYHSFTDLKIVVFTNSPDSSRWDYLRILPHCWDNQHNVRYFSTTSDEFKEATLELESIFDGRRDDAVDVQEEDDGKRKDMSDDKHYKSYRPYYLIFTDNIDAIRNTSLIKKVLNYKVNLGFGLIIENDTLSNIPDQAIGFISVSETKSGMFTNNLKIDDKLDFKVDYDTKYSSYNCAQLLANIPIMVDKGRYELPKSLSFLEMYQVGRVEQLNSLDRWNSSNPTNTLSVPIGIDQNGELFKMDVHEKAYGPHGLIAGTTGSGKSEWIITFILSLAINYSPDEVQFVLIDYKGGGLAMSFENKELGIKLPHLAGTVTNLDKSAINRSIDSMESELKRRQSIFNEAREKLKEGQMDIYKYQQFYRKGLVDTPLSHLFIICDEFAELKSQQPEFMDQLISISRIGRSLGVHLILATQKPSGVVNDQIWSNSRFKVCLRVQDKSDSNEILKKPDAAFLKQVGSFYLEVGNDEYYNLGQSAWAGAKYFPSDVVSHEVDQSVQQIDNVGTVVNYYDVEDNNANKEEKSQGEELLNIVKYVDNISKDEHFVKQQLWLPSIPEMIYLSEIKKKYNFSPKKLDFTTAIGEYDEPRRQEQNILTINIEDGNIAIVGQPGSGKELLLSTMIFSSITEHTPSEINYYILDFGAETLRKFSKFPHVGEVVFQSDMERVGGVIQLIAEEFEKRKQLFQDYNGSFRYYNEHSEEQLPLLCLVINGYDVFGELLMKLVDSLTSLYRDAPRYGIIFILSASAQNTFRPRILQYFNKFILMNLQDEMQYRSLSNCRKGLVPSNLYGRGLCKISDDDDSYCEFQTAHIIDEERELAYLNQVADTLLKGYSVRARKLTTIPENVTSDDLAKYLTTKSDFPVGYNFYEKDIAKLDISKSKIYPITTVDLRSNIKFIYALANLLSKIPDTVVRVIDVSHLFEKPLLDIKLFRDGLDAVFAAIAKDEKSRTATQPLAINIVVGAASIKNVLSSVGQDYANQFFNNMINAKQNQFILVDDYKKFKLLKLESWYNAIDTSNGMWLGDGIESQSVLITNDVSNDDKKFKYEGKAYLIKDGNYTLIKTMMDGDD